MEVVRIVAGYSKHQLKIISNYYEHRETLMLQKLGELATELVLADSDRQRDRLWGRVAAAMANLQIPPTLTEHILTSRDPEILARNLNDWLAGKMPRRPEAKKPPGARGRRHDE